MRCAMRLNVGRSVVSTCCSRSVCAFSSPLMSLKIGAGVADRPAVAGLDDAQQRREPVVDLDREVQRILIALVPHLIDLFLDRRQLAS